MHHTVFSLLCAAGAAFGIINVRYNWSMMATMSCAVVAIIWGVPATLPPEQAPYGALILPICIVAGILIATIEQIWAKYTASES